MENCKREQEIQLMKATLEAVRHEQRKTRASAIATRKQSKIDSKRASVETKKTRRYIIVAFVLGAVFELITTIWSSS